MICDERLIWVMDGRRPCLEKTEVYARVCGFFRPVQAWNLGKKEEYRERKVFRFDRAEGNHLLCEPQSRPTGGEVL